MLVDKRRGPRKVLRSRAVFMLDGANPIHARTRDIAAGGVSLTLPDSVRAEQQGMVSFEMFFQGKLNVITTRVSVSHCIFSSEGFKVGLVFSVLEPVAATAIAQYMR